MWKLQLQNLLEHSPMLAFTFLVLLHYKIHLNTRVIKTRVYKRTRLPEYIIIQIESAYPRGIIKCPPKLNLNALRYDSDGCLIFYYEIKAEIRFKILNGKVVKYSISLRSNAP